MTPLGVRHHRCMYSRSRVGVGVALLTVALLTGCKPNHARPNAATPTANSTSLGIASIGPEAIVGSWKVSAEGEEAGTVLRIGENLTLWRMCGTLQGAWSANRMGGFVGYLGGGSQSCFTKHIVIDPAWLTAAVAIRAINGGLELVNKSGNVTASLQPGASPTPGTDIIDSAAAPPMVTDTILKAFAASQPHGLPKGWSPASASELVANWVPLKNSLKARVTPSLRFASDGSINGSDGCNGVGGRWSTTGAGYFLSVRGPSTLIGCDGVAIDSFFANASTVGIAGDRLQFFTSQGKALGVLRRDVAGDFASVWPEPSPDQSQVYGASWRADAASTAKRFAVDVLKWGRPLVTVKSTPSDGTAELLVRPRAGAHAVVLHLAHVIDSKQWSVTYMWGFGTEEPHASVGIGLEEATVSYGYKAPGLSAELRLSYPQKTYVKKAVGTAHWKFAIENYYEPSGMCASMMVIYRNSSGEAVTGWATPIPVGVFAAG